MNCALCEEYIELVKKLPKRCKRCNMSGMITWRENQAPFGSGMYWPETLSEPCECVESNLQCPRCGHPFVNYVIWLCLRANNLLWKACNYFEKKNSKDKRLYGIRVSKITKENWDIWISVRLVSKGYRLAGITRYPVSFDEDMECKKCGWSIGYGGLEPPMCYAHHSKEREK